MLSLAATVPFDDRLNQRARVEDLSRELMRDFLKEVGSDLAAQADTLPLVELGRQMNVIGGSAEAPFPLNVGLLFFNPEPFRFFPVTQIDVVWFPDGAGGDKFTEKEFRGPLPRMLRESLNYIRRNYISETIIKHHDRAEATRVENFPYPAIEEAIVNAIYHSSYEVREPVEVRIYKDELIVLSYPGPDRSMRLEQLRGGRAIPRRYRNRRIGEFLKQLEFTEGRSTGIPKIMRAMQDNGSPPAEFEFDEDHSDFMVRLPVQPDAPQVTLPVVTAGLESGLDIGIEHCWPPMFKLLAAVRFSMPLPININDLLHGKAVEWKRLEFKQGWNPLDTLHTPCAFANDFHNLGGGYVIVGVAEKDGQPLIAGRGIAGLDRSREIPRELAVAQSPAEKSFLKSDIGDFSRSKSASWICRQRSNSSDVRLARR